MGKRRAFPFLIATLAGLIFVVADCLHDGDAPIPVFWGVIGLVIILLGVGLILLKKTGEKE